MGLLRDFRSGASERLAYEEFRADYESIRLVAHTAPGFEQESAWQRYLLEIISLSLRFSAVVPAFRAESAAIAAALARLRAKDREILELRVFDGLSYREIGDLYGCSENAAQKRYDRVQKRMRRLLVRTQLYGRKNN